MGKTILFHVLDHCLCASPGTIPLCSRHLLHSLLLIEIPRAVSSWTALNKFTRLHPLSLSTVAWLGVFLTQTPIVSSSCMGGEMTRDTDSLSRADKMLC